MDYLREQTRELQAEVLALKDAWEAAPLDRAVETQYFERLTALDRNLEERCIQVEDISDGPSLGL